MADRVSASIILGGVVSAADFTILAQLIADEGLSLDWDGPWFTPADVEPGKPLSLKAREVVGGQFDELEAWCVEKGLPFVRWSDAYCGVWDAERVVFRGAGEPQDYRVDQDDNVVIGRAAIEALGDLASILAFFDGAAFTVPPLSIVKDAQANAVAALNDAHRGQTVSGWVTTAGVMAHGPVFLAAAVAAVQAFDAFTPGDDPYGERDFGAFDLKGQRLFWKIDYYDLDLCMASPDPADPAVTKRVLTLMLAEEY